MSSLIDIPSALAYFFSSSNAQDGSRGDMLDDGEERSGEVRARLEVFPNLYALPLKVSPTCKKHKCRPISSTADSGQDDHIVGIFHVMRMK